MKLYHAGISTCSQKVRLVLAEKELEFESVEINLQQGKQFEPDYLAMNPAGVVPTLRDHGKVFIESTLINEYLDDAYPEIPLRPIDPVACHAMRLWCKRIDELHPHCGVITYAIGARPGLLSRPTAEVDALVEAIPDPSRRALRRSVIDHGVRAPEFARACDAHDRLFAQAEAALSGRTFLVHDLFTLADAALLPYVLRADHLGLVQLLEDRPALMNWYERVCALPCYQQAVGEWLPEAAVNAFRAAGAAVAAEVVEILHS
jgi:glutathione S-transferase